MRLALGLRTGLNERLIMGLREYSYTFDGPLPSVSLVVKQIGERHEIEQVEQPGGVHFMIHGQNVPVLVHDRHVEVVLRGLGWFTRGRMGRSGIVRRALMQFGSEVRGIEAPRARHAPFTRLLMTIPRNLETVEIERAIARVTGRSCHNFPFGARTELWFGQDRTPVSLSKNEDLLVADAFTEASHGFEEVHKAILALGGSIVEKGRAGAA